MNDRHKVVIAKLAAYAFVYGGGTMLVLFGLMALGLISRLTWLAFTLGWRVLG